MTPTYFVQSLTPIVTGDHDRCNKELLATGLLGSLRYQYWLLKAMEAWEKSQQDNKQPEYPLYSADLTPGETIKDKTQRLATALKTVGPVVGLFGGTGWKRMFRLDIVNPRPGDVQPASARSGKYEARHWKFTLCFSQDRQSSAFEKQFETTVAQEFRCLMSFVHHYGWLGAAPQNGDGRAHV